MTAETAARCCRLCVQISAKKGDGVDDLLETVLLTAEVEELMANPDRPARGTVIESHLGPAGPGAVATVLVAAGTLRQGDIVQAGATYGKVGGPHAPPVVPFLDSRDCCPLFTIPWTPTRRVLQHHSASFSLGCALVYVPWITFLARNTGLRCDHACSLLLCMDALCCECREGVCLSMVDALLLGRVTCFGQHVALLACCITLMRTCFPRARAQVRSLRESRGDVTEAGPSIAVQMAGLNGVPTAGDEFCRLRQ